jgi:hypothetical protein
MMLYIHIDPGSRKLLYIGVSVDYERSHNFSSREGRHRDRLKLLLSNGYTKQQIAHVVADNLSYGAAYELERKLIRLLLPPLNTEHHPAWEEELRKPTNERRTPSVMFQEVT